MESTSFRCISHFTLRIWMILDPIFLIYTSCLALQLLLLDPISTQKQARTRALTTAHRFLKREIRNTQNADNCGFIVEYGPQQPRLRTWIVQQPTPNGINPLPYSRWLHGWSISARSQSAAKPFSETKCRQVSCLAFFFLPSKLSAA